MNINSNHLLNYSCIADTVLSTWHTEHIIVKIRALILQKRPRPGCWSKDLAPPSCSSQAQGPRCCHNLETFVLSLVISDQVLRAPDRTMRELRMPQWPYIVTQVLQRTLSHLDMCHWAPPWVLAFLGKEEMGQKRGIKRNIAKGGRNRSILWVPPSCVLDDYIQLDRPVLFGLFHFRDEEMGAHREGKGLVSGLTVSQRRKEG